MHSAANFSRVCVSFGANLGDAQQTVLKAIELVGQISGTHLIKASSLYETEPFEAQGPDFVNAVALFDTALQPNDFLTELQKLEDQYGRKRSFINAPRTLDLDLIFYDDLILNSDQLTLPHPRWSERAFVVIPMMDICPERVSQAHLDSIKNQFIRRIVSSNCF